MEEQTAEIRIPIPEGAHEVCILGIVQFIDTDGELRYGVATRGSAVMTTYLGLTIVAQDHIKGWGSDRG